MIRKNADGILAGKKRERERAKLSREAILNLVDRERERRREGGIFERNGEENEIKKVRLKGIYSARGIMYVPIGLDDSKI